MNENEKTIAPEWLHLDEPLESAKLSDDIDKTVSPNLDNSEFSAGQKILDRYTILSVIGQGSMGIVYKCYDETGCVEVAIKALLPSISHDSKAISFIRANFQIIEKLHHPHIANIKQLEKDCSTGYYYLIMEYVEGITLTEWIQKNHGSSTFPVLLQIAETLDFVHNEKVIHRDIKPDNIMITSAGEVKILDFGIATSYKSILWGKNNSCFCGTALYMAPELWNLSKNEKITPAVDQYSLAVISCECLYGCRPIEASTFSELKSIISSNKLNLPVKASLHERHVLKKALSPIANERYKTCSDFINNLFNTPLCLSRNAWIMTIACVVCGLMLYFFFFKAEPLPQLPKPYPTTEPINDGIIRKKSSPRLLIRSQEKIRNIKTDSLSQGLLQELALQYGFQTINPDFTKDRYDFIIDVKFSGAYRFETMSFNQNIKLHAFSLGADICATYPNGNLISQVTLPSKDYRIGKIGDSQEALRSAMHKRLAAEDEVSFRNLLLDILNKWCVEEKDGMQISLYFENSTDKNFFIQEKILNVLGEKKLLSDCTFREQNETGLLTWEIRTKLRNNDLALLVVTLSRQNYKVKTIQYNKIVFERK